MRRRLLLPGLALLLTTFLILSADVARADVHFVRVFEFYTQCNDGRNDVQYIELRTVANQFFRQCASIEIKRTVGGPNVFFAKPVFVGHTNDEVFATSKAFLIATPAFQAATGIVPDLVIPNGTLATAGGVIRFAADSGCEPNTNWGTIHEVRYGDQGTVPAPGPHQAANYSSVTGLFTLGNRSPKNFAGATTTTWTCDTTPANVTVTSPDGGEVLPAGTSQPITWTATDNGIITGVNIEYSTNGGGSYTTIASGKPNNGLFDWDVPNEPTTQALVRITVADLGGNSGQDVSNAFFTITAPSSNDTTPPVVQVIRPNGGETFIVGNLESIQWNATDDVGVANVDLFYSTDFGAIWKPIAAGEVNDGQFDWPVPSDLAILPAFVRVVARDTTQNSGFDDSDAPFSIQNLASVPFLPPVITKPLVLQNRPNPFNPGTFIGFALPAPGRVRIEVFALDGRRVKTLLDQVGHSGYTEVFWDGADDNGRTVPSGIYFYRFESGAVSEVRRMTLTK
jgi:hypothetical protein